MNRDVPVFRGKGDAERVRLIQSVSVGVLLISTVVAGLVMVVSLAFLEHIPRAPLSRAHRALRRDAALLFLASLLKVRRSV